MNPIQPGGSNRSAGSRQDLADLHEALKAAATVLGLSDAVRVTGAALLNRIPRDAPSPTSPASVAGLAAERGCGERTIRNHIQTLIRSGLAQNRCLDGGRRHCHRDQGGDIVAIYGIDFTLLADRAPDLASDLEQIRQDRIEATRLRHEISRLRRTIRHIIALHPVTAEQHREWGAFPRRLAHLGRDALEMWISRVKALHATLIKSHPDDRGRQNGSDRPEKVDRQYMTYQDMSEIWTPPETVGSAGMGAGRRDRAAV